MKVQQILDLFERCETTIRGTDASSETRIKYNTLKRQIREALYADAGLPNVDGSAWRITAMANVTDVGTRATNALQHILFFLSELSEPQLADLAKPPVG
jgi:hypothetical protein